MDDFKLAVLKNHFDYGLLDLLEEYFREKLFEEFSNQLIITETNLRTDISNLYNEIYTLTTKLEWEQIDNKKLKEEIETLNYKLNNLKITF